MGFEDGYSWNDKKDETLLKDRGYRLIDVAKKIFSQDYAEYIHSNYLDQVRAVGFVDDKIMTITYRFIEDEHSEFIELITYWPASKKEQRLLTED